MARVFIILALLMSLGCAATEQVSPTSPDSKVSGTYRVVLPGGSWRPLEVEGADVAMGQGEKAAFAILSPSKIDKALPLEVLRLNLLLEVKNKKILYKGSAVLDGQPALHTILEGTVEGDKVRIESYVAAKGGLVYDLVYWAGPAYFQAFQGDFEGVVKSFRFVEPLVGR